MSRQFVDGSPTKVKRRSRKRIFTQGKKALVRKSLFAFIHHDDDTSSKDRKKQQRGISLFNGEFLERTIVPQFWRSGKHKGKECPNKFVTTSVYRVKIPDGKTVDDMKRILASFGINAKYGSFQVGHISVGSGEKIRRNPAKAAFKENKKILEKNLRQYILRLRQGEKVKTFGNVVPVSPIGPMPVRKDSYSLSDETRETLKKGHSTEIDKKIRRECKGIRPIAEITREYDEVFAKMSSFDVDSIPDNLCESQKTIASAIVRSIPSSEKHGKLWAAYMMNADFMDEIEQWHGNRRHLQRLSDELKLAFGQKTNGPKAEVCIPIEEWNFQEEKRHAEIVRKLDMKRREFWQEELPRQEELPTSY